MSQDIRTILESFNKISEAPGDSFATDLLDYMYRKAPVLFRDYGDEFMVHLITDIEKSVPTVTPEEIVSWALSADEYGQPLTVDEFMDWQRYDDQGNIKEDDIDEPEYDDQDDFSDDEDLEEDNTEVKKQGSKVIVTKNGNTTTYDDEDTAKAILGGGDDKSNQFTTEDDNVLSQARSYGYEEYTDGHGPDEIQRTKNTEALYKVLKNAGLNPILKKLGDFDTYRNEFPEEEFNETVVQVGDKVVGYDRWGFVGGVPGRGDDLDQVSLEAAYRYLANSNINEDAPFMSAEDEPELSTFDFENHLHRKRLQRGTPVVLSPELFKNPNVNRQGVFVSRSPSGDYCKVIRNYDGKEVNCHMSDIVSADIHNNSIYESYNTKFEKMLGEDITITNTNNPETPENNTTTVTAIGPESVDELAAIMANAGLTAGYEPVTQDMMHEPDVVDTGMPVAGGPDMDYDVTDDAATYDFDLDEDDGEWDESIEDPIYTDSDDEWYDNKGHLDRRGAFDAGDHYDLERDVNHRPFHDPNDYDFELDFDEDLDEERDVDYSNTPDELEMDTDFMVHGLDGGLDSEKRMFRKEYPGDNPMAVNEEYDDEYNPEYGVYNRKTGKITRKGFDREEAYAYFDGNPKPDEEMARKEKGKWYPTSYANDDVTEDDGIRDIDNTNANFDNELDNISKGLAHDEDQLGEDEMIDEKAAPGQEEWVRKNKQNFINQYGKEKGLNVLYATSWKRHEKNESVRPGQALDETDSFLNLYKVFTQKDIK